MIWLLPFHDTMQYNELGQSGLSVSRLCFGTLTIGPSQAALCDDEAASLIVYSLNKGINFLDTAELYDNYDVIRKVLRQCSRRPVIATKTYAYTRQQAQASFDLARKKLDTDCIDIFLLHEQESMLTMAGHHEAFSFMLELKEKGLVRAIGLSTHAIEPVRALADAKSSHNSIWHKHQLEPGAYRYADIIHPLINLRGIGILDGSAGEMITACRQAQSTGLGLYGMKALGGGHLLPVYCEAMAFMMDLEFLSSVAVGMQSQDEIDTNLSVFSGLPVSDKQVKQAMRKKRQLRIEDWCSGCGKCVERCGEDALYMLRDKAHVNQQKCVYCGYCASVCREFAIKIF